jgi:hypothetical protein
LSPPLILTAAGTDIELRGIPDSEIDAAKDFFLCFSGERVLDETQYGQILERRSGAVPEFM